MATVVLAVVVEVASASRFAVSNQRIRATWAALALEFGSGLGTVRCAVTLEGSFHSSTFAKVTGSLIGLVTRARMQQPCTGGVVRVLNGTETGSTNTLPWHLRYDSFRGSLPAVTAIRLQIVGFGFYFTLMETRCLYASTAARPIFATYLPGVEEEIFRVPPSLSLEGRVSENVGGCLGTMGVAGMSRLTVLGGSEEVRLQLA
jgi:hypothetical protein